MTNESQPIEPRSNQTQHQRNQLKQQQFLALPEIQELARIARGTGVQTEAFSAYSPSSSAFDEVLDSSGMIRNHWTQLIGGLRQIGNSGIEHRCQQIRRMIHQNGIAYTAYGDPSVRDQHLQLDPIPQVIPEDQWLRLTEGLSQRATLLNRILADLFGPRKLLTEGVLPHDVLFDHPHYQLAYQDLPPAGDQHLHFYSAKIVRLASGEWWVKSDRTDSPGGWGFALENRIAISRAFPNQFRRANVERLAPFFIAVRRHLIGLAKHRTSDPHIVILSAGAGSPSYFEDSYLAGYLGFTLVQANDLVVRSGKLMLKTLAGLTPVDVVLRRRSGFHLDPLELGGVSPGIPGLFQVIRDGNVAIANAPGSGLIESPILMAFMPRICKALLQTNLLIPGIATWWGGEPESLELILDRIDDVNLIPAFRRRTIDGKGNNVTQSRPPIDPQALSRDQRIDLVRRDPKHWVGRERTECSSTAVWKDGCLTSEHFSMRAFLTASEGSWQAMPGGLARLTDNPDEIIQSPFAEGGTKDIWVLSTQPVAPVSLLRPMGRFDKSRSQGFLSSRMADNLFWLGRYVIRAESGARLLRSVVLRMIGENEPEELLELPWLVRAMALEGSIEVGYAIKEFAKQLPKLEQWLPASALNFRDPSSLRSQVNQVVGLSARVRERLSNDAWRVIQDVNNDFNDDEPDQCDLNDLLEITNTLVVNLSSFSGLISESMTRTHAFAFLNIGRRLEYSLQIVGLLRVCLAEPENVTAEMLEAVLEISDSTLTYTTRHYADFQMPAVLDLLLMDELNPRSLAFQLRELNTHVESLPGIFDQDSELPIQRLAMDALNTVRMADVEQLSITNELGKRDGLVRLFDRMEKQLPEIATLLSNRFFVHSGNVTQLVADEFGNTRG